MPTYTWNVSSSSSIVYNRDPGGFLEIKYKNKTIHMPTDYLISENLIQDDDTYGGRMFLDSGSDASLYLIHNEGGDSYISFTMESGEIQLIHNIPNELRVKLEELSDAIMNDTEMPSGYNQSGGRRRKTRKTRNTRKSKKAHKAHKAHKARKTIRN
jgi:hypothetical protein